ncbi:MAG TPA: hypothetical protein VEC02_05675 [Nitrososphaerales archaeon]|nr:hypothetical protein [Nitrososphaerales archaeon]
MKLSRSALGTPIVFAVVTVAVVALSAATVMLYPQSSNGAPSSTLNTSSSSQSAGTTYIGPGSSAESTNSSLGLRLTLSVNSTRILSQDVIIITASVQNTLPTANNLAASDNWAVGGLRSGPCDPGNSTNKLFSPVGLGVFKGTYGLNNLSKAGSPLSVWAMVECLADLVFIDNQSYGLSSITGYSLLPGSDNGTYAAYYDVPGTPPPPSCNSGVCRYTQTPENLARGVFPTTMVDQATIYAANSTGLDFYDSLLSSLPANYTLVAGDEWGQLTLLHFTVVASNNLPQVGTFLAKTGGCMENGNPVPCVTSDFSQALIFNCAAQAATTSGCATRASSSGPWGSSYAITVWYPYTGQPGEPAGDNCKYSAAGDTGPPYGHCFMVNATAFALSPSSAMSP